MDTAKATALLKQAQATIAGAQETIAAILVELTAPVVVPTPAPTPAYAGRVPENPIGAVPGMNYEYYEDKFLLIPDFTKLKPLRTGYQAQPAAVVPASRADNYALRFTGFIYVPADGEWTFYLNSDDGSRLWIGPTLVVDNDGGHALLEKSGKMALQKGWHISIIGYYEYNGDQQLIASYSGPNQAKTVIPAAAYSRLAPVATPAQAPVATLNNFTATAQ